jgi:hypothetical protein
MVSDYTLLTELGKIELVPRKMVRMMKNRRHYCHVANTLITKDPLTVKELLDEREDPTRKLACDDEDIIFHCNFRDRPNPKKALWLRVPVRSHQDGHVTTLEEMREFTPLCNYFRDADVRRHLTVRWYARSRDMAREIYSVLGKRGVWEATPPE